MNSFPLTTDHSPLPTSDGGDLCCFTVPTILDVGSGRAGGWMVCAADLAAAGTALVSSGVSRTARFPIMNATQPQDGPLPDAYDPSRSPAPDPPPHPLISHRLWMAILGVGLLGAVLGGSVVLVATMPGAGEESKAAGDVPPEHTASAWLRVTVRQPSLVFRTADYPSAGEFEVYKRTQGQLIKSRQVLSTALHRAKEAAPAVVRGKDYSIDWLADRLEVTFPGDAEIMQVSISGDDAQAAGELVNAVVDTYLDQVVGAEHGRRRRRLAALEELYTKKSMEVERKRSELKRLAEMLGTGDPMGSDLNGQIALQDHAERRRELTPLRIELRQAESELKMHEASLSDDGQIPISEPELDAFVQSDSVAEQLLYQLGQLQQRLDDVKTTAIPPAKTEYTEKFQRDFQVLKQQFDARRAALYEELKSRKRAVIEADAKRLRTRIAVLSQQEDKLETTLREDRQQIELLSRPSIELEMRRDEIQRLSRVLGAVAEEIDVLKVELEAGPRVTLVQHAEVPKGASD